MDEENDVMTKFAAPAPASTPAPNKTDDGRKPKLTDEQTLKLKGWLLKNMQDITRLYKSTFESEGKVITYGIIPVNSSIPAEYVGFKPSFSIYIQDETGKIVARVSSVSMNTINITFINFEEISGKFNFC